MSTRMILLAVMYFGATPALGAQGRWDRQVDARVTQASTALGRGFSAAGLAGRGSLNTGESATFSITLPAGVPTILTGVCDEDCVDLDLSLSTNGYDTDAARGGGNAPIVRVTPTDRTTYRITIHMGDCRRNPCWFGVEVFRQIRTDSP